MGDWSERAEVKCHFSELTLARSSNGNFWKEPEVDILKMGILVSVPFPISQGPIQFFASKHHLRNGMWAFKILISNFPFLISNFSFPISHFLMLKSHSSFQFSSYYMFPCHHFLIFIIRVWLKCFLTKTVIKHLWIIWTLKSQLLTWSGKQEMGNRKWEMRNEKSEMRSK